MRKENGAVAGKISSAERLPEFAMGFLLLLFVYLLSGRAGVLASAQNVEAEKAQPVVCIDVGHGGMDPGKVGVDGTLEKNINLQIAKRLKTDLEAADVRVVMTREDDNGLYAEDDSHKKAADMRNRVAAIGAASPALVVSIHQNSYHEEAVCGGQVFYYKDSVKGKQLAEILQKRFDYVLGEQNRRQAKPNGNYYLLLHVKQPIVIVECGFLSNRTEARKLASPDYQSRLAWTLHLGILEYLNVTI